MAADIFVFGDWHGNLRFAGQALNAARHINADAYLIHVGDFGLYPSDFGRLYLTEINDALTAPLHVIPGNHEYWPALTFGSELGFADLDDHGFWYTPLYPNIRVSPRTHTWTWHDHRLASLSGANSIDFQHRKQGVSWWPEESPTTEHVDELVTLIDGHDVDVLLTHDAPYEAIQAGNLYSTTRNTGWSDIALDYANESAKTVGQARNRLLHTSTYAGTTTSENRCTSTTPPSNSSPTIQPRACAETVSTSPSPPRPSTGNDHPA